MIIFHSAEDAMLFCPTRAFIYRRIKLKVVCIVRPLDWMKRFIMGLLIIRWTSNECVISFGGRRYTLVAALQERVFRMGEIQEYIAN
jgi:hypothetical protein